MAEFETLGLLADLEAIANARHDGVLTILKIRTDWRVGFIIPTDRTAIQSLAVADSFAAAARAAITADKPTGPG